MALTELAVSVVELGRTVVERLLSRVDVAAGWRRAALPGRPIPPAARRAAASGLPLRRPTAPAPRPTPHAPVPALGANVRRPHPNVGRDRPGPTVRGDLLGQRVGDRIQLLRELRFELRPIRSRCAASAVRARSCSSRSASAVRAAGGGVVAGGVLSSMPCSVQVCCRAAGDRERTADVCAAWAHSPTPTEHRGIFPTVYRPKGLDRSKEPGPRVPILPVARDVKHADAGDRRITARERPD